jgi:pimeloyl-ACP methyl ester carboxylesterase
MSIPIETVKTAEFEMQYFRFGTGARPFVILPGLSVQSVMGAADAVAAAYAGFAGDYTVYVFDRRADLPETYSVYEMGLDTAEAMRALGLHDADVFGASQGGMMAQVLAAKRPELVRRLVLAVTTCKSGETLKNVIARWVDLTEQADWKNLVADMAYRMYSAKYMRRYRPLLPLLTAVQKPRDVQRFLVLAKTCADFDAEDLLEGIRCPVYVIGGKRDLVLGEGACEALARKLGCECHVYEELGHAAYEEAKDFNQRIYAFLKE